MNIEKTIDLFEKYNTPTGRFLCHPSLSNWNNNLKHSSWIKNIRNNYNSSLGIDLYIHIPFCKTLCTFCGCNIYITKNIELEKAYIKTILTEWNNYLSELGDIKIASIYLGGGTPTHLSIDNLALLLNGILKVKTTDNFYGVVETTPTFSDNKQKLELLNSFNFNQIILGIQDFNDEIVTNLNRKQTIHDIFEITNLARAIGFTTITYEFIFGLWGQTANSFKSGLTNIEQLKPDNILLYPLAITPWQKSGEKSDGKLLLPNLREKYHIYLKAQQYLEEQNYIHIGMNFYSKHKNRYQYRNIMGFKEYPSNQIIGLGSSAISYSGKSYIQNHRVFDSYINSNNKFIFKSHRQTEEEIKIYQTLNQIICTKQCGVLSIDNDIINDLQKDQIITISQHNTNVNNIDFLKNICQEIINDN